MELHVDTTLTRTRSNSRCILQIHEGNCDLNLLMNLLCLNQWSIFLNYFFFLSNAWKRNKMKHLMLENVIQYTCIDRFCLDQNPPTYFSSFIWHAQSLFFFSHHAVIMYKWLTKVVSNWSNGIGLYRNRNTKDERITV